MHDEAEFLAGYDPGAYPAVAVTVDVVALTIHAGRLCVLLVERGEQPFAGRRALPGGFVRDEALDVAAMRELGEETGVHLERVHLEQLKTYGDPGRDPRMRVFSVAYLAFAPSLPEPESGTDAAGAYWVPVEEATGLAFDHDVILADGLERARAKLEYTPLATAFAGDEFTISELRQIYTAVWGEELHAGNFHRKVLSVPGFVESTGETAPRGGERGGPKPKLYRAGDARLLHPALLRPTREDDVR
ncbi:NUDIX hydrolase [Paractinoplanes brasiliensis]|uniref:8-oxo-dGTP diphosphatase n=1 Tax=Paractinoplanes brasiliensis TaxID=52695 RepID=A0A4R6JZK3_9ACTN|nr:NUDIX domain-containing protein [Actinoplanes brasiliensis]TDO41352.1 8-oxo-dGTP diphosphatase [Actinoplanes brasiliensis]GID27365.1 NUDIX hydrolase [Actinoplanes brasiliensis]